MTDMALYLEHYLQVTDADTAKALHNMPRIITSTGGSFPLRTNWFAVTKVSDRYRVQTEKQWALRTLLSPSSVVRKFQNHGLLMEEIPYRSWAGIPWTLLRQSKA